MVTGSTKDTSSPRRSRELDLMILMGPFQLKTFYDTKAVKLEKLTEI